MTELSNGTSPTPLPSPAPPVPIAPLSAPVAPPIPAPDASAVLQSTRVTNNDVFKPTNPKDLALRSYERVLSDQRLEDGDNLTRDRVYLSLFTPCTPLIQNGPRCGLVAMAMAGEMSGQPLDPDVIFENARGQGFTKQGEMFSAQDMCRLCEELLGQEAVLVNPDSERRTLISCLLNCQPILYPYDADRNHQPCLKRGHKAHWGLLTGMFCGVEQSQLGVLEECEGTLLVKCDCQPELYMVENLSIYAQQFLTSDLCKRSADVWVYGQHGKSRHPALWPLCQLIESNGNLTELDPEKAVDIKDWVLPEGGLVSGLKNRAIILRKSLQL